MGSGEKIVFKGRGWDGGWGVRLAKCTLQSVVILLLGFFNAGMQRIFFFDTLFVRSRRQVGLYIMIW